MNIFFNKLGSQLYDIIGSPENNTVGYAASQIFSKGYASGGVVTDEDGTRLTDSDPIGVNSLIRKAGNSLTKGLSTAADTYGKSFKDQMTMGHFIHTNFGQFFKGADPGGTNQQIKMPTNSVKATQATDPTEYYSRWYESMRRFAQANEVAAHGQQTVRSR